ncbi:MAG: alginate export family protein [Pseudomonadota bacterium]
MNMPGNIRQQHFIFRRQALLRAFTIVVPVLLSLSTMPTALAEGKLSGELRYRYEWVEQQGFSLKARASTLRTQLGYDTGDYRGFGAFVQLEDVRHVGAERYNSSINGLTQYPAVTDPSDTELNQAYVSYKGLPGTALKGGRQVITYDNHRFIGDVGWRQNQQTYDALTLVNTTFSDMTISYAYVTNVNRIFSERHTTLSDVEMQSNLINAAYKGLPAGTLVGYGYFIDYDPNQPFAVTASHRNLGIRFDGSYAAGDHKWLYTVEHARQDSHADGASTIDATYRYGMIGVDIAGIQFKLNYELLSGNGVYALQTPLATLHAHNGWADKFLSTPLDGLVDVSVSVGTTLGPVNLLGVYRDYSSDNLGYAYGQETDLLATWKAAKNFTLLAKVARYRGDTNATNVTRNLALSQDVTKYWLQASYQF